MIQIASHAGKAANLFSAGRPASQQGSGPIRVQMSLICAATRRRARRAGSRRAVPARAAVDNCDSYPPSLMLVEWLKEGCRLRCVAANKRGGVLAPAAALYGRSLPVDRH